MMGTAAMTNGRNSRGKKRLHPNINSTLEGIGYLYNTTTSLLMLTAVISCIVPHVLKNKKQAKEKIMKNREHQPLE